MERYLEKGQRGTADFPFAYYKQNYTDLHWHPEMELILMIRGELAVTVAEENYVLYAGDILFVNPDELHSFTSQKEGTEYHAAVFKAELFWFKEKHFFQEEFTSRMTKGEMRFPRIFRREEKDYALVYPIVDALFNKHLHSKAMIYSDLIQLFCVFIEQKLFVQTVNPSIHKSSEDIKRCILYMEENYTRKVTLAELAELIHMTPNYFCGYFKRITGVSPFTQLNEIRIRSAAELLEKSEISVNAAAEACGFENVNYFIKRFKEIKGCTPAAYRKNKMQQRI